MIFFCGLESCFCVVIELVWAILSDIYQSDLKEMFFILDLGFTMEVM